MDVSSFLEQKVDEMIDLHTKHAAVLRMAIEGPFGNSVSVAACGH